MPEITLDVSRLEPPEPLVRTLAAVEELSPGDFLRMRHRRTPCLLYDNLEQRGFASLTRRGMTGVCEVFIWRRNDGGAETLARAAAEGLEPWEE